MPCTRPLPVRWDPDEGRLTFQPREGSAHRLIGIPCGKCPDCCRYKRGEWAFRLQAEARLHERNCFVTLTYAPEHLPEWASLDKEHLALFWKALRNAGLKIRYYAVGEYGDKGNRPHYHAALFNWDFHKDRKHFYFDDEGNEHFTSDELSKAWGKGHCELTDLTEGTANYVCKYVLKSLDERKEETRYDPRTGEVHEVLPTFSTMSRRPGIGRGHLDQFKDGIATNGSVHINGKTGPLPKYFKKILAEEADPRYVSAQANSRRVASGRRARRRLLAHDDDRARELVATKLAKERKRKAKL